MVAFPRIVEYLFSKGVVYVVLVSVFFGSLNSESVLVDPEAIVRPKGVIEGEGTLLACGHIRQDSLGTVLKTKKE